MRVIGERFGGGFQLLRELAHGASARVFLASDGERVKAVKLYLPAHRHRAEHERLLGGGLEHPHLNPVEALVDIAGYPGVVMPFVPGRRLGDWLSEKDAGAFLDTFSGVLGGSSTSTNGASSIKTLNPENIIVNREGVARLIDSDLAVRIGDVRKKRGFAGTIAFLSPDQAAGKEITPASYLYAAGIILYWGLTGQVPFDGSVAEVLAAHRREPPPPPSSLEARLEPFDPFFDRLLAKAPEARFASAAEGVERLRVLRQELARLRSQAPSPFGLSRWRVASLWTRQKG